MEPRAIGGQRGDEGARSQRSAKAHERRWTPTSPLDPAASLGPRPPRIEDSTSLLSSKGYGLNGRLDVATHEFISLALPVRSSTLSQRQLPRHLIS